MKREADVIVVGSGAAGASIARELARSGLDVLILERGRHHGRFFGTHLAPALMADRMGLRFSREGIQCIRAITTGGTTMISCGTYGAPPHFLLAKADIDLSREIDEVRRDLGVAPLPDRFLRGSGEILMEAAGRLGLRWEAFEKFIDPNLCRQGCSACPMGCPTGAKWTARRYVEDALHHGATLHQPVEAIRIVHSGGIAQGVFARTGMAGRNTREYRAPVVILAAGGMGSAPILRRSGIREAGRGLCIDPLVVVSGVYGGGQGRTAENLSGCISRGGTLRSPGKTPGIPSGRSHARSPGGLAPVTGIPHNRSRAGTSGGGPFAGTSGSGPFAGTSGSGSPAGTCYNPPMSVGTWEFYESEGFMLTAAIDPWLLFSLQMAMVAPGKLPAILNYRQTLGIMVKIRDDLAGELFEDGSFSKPLTDSDRTKLERGAAIASEILLKAGCRRGSLVRTAVRGGHPGATCRIGHVVDANLETAIDNLFVSDASVFPESLGMPLIATLVALNKKLARHIRAHMGHTQTPPGQTGNPMDTHRPEGDP
jgi:choline dehydrogenase-like flavoprotein